MSDCANSAGLSNTGGNYQYPQYPARPCRTCGACPTCGRGSTTYPPAWYPYQSPYLVSNNESTVPSLPMNTVTIRN